MRIPLLSIFFALLFAWLILSGSALFAQDDPFGEAFEEQMTEPPQNTFGIGGVLDLVHTEGDDPDINKMTHGFGNFNNARALLDFNFNNRGKIDGHIEVLLDEGSEDLVRLHGAFITIFNIPDERINLMVGKIPHVFGNFNKRENSDANPLIGYPLMRHYSTAVDWNNLWLNRGQIILRNRRSEFNGNLPRSVLSGASPVVYPSCWDIGANLFGSISFLDYQFAVTEGALSNPEARRNDGKQFVTRLGFNVSPAFKFGFSGARAPYLASAEDQRLLEQGKGLGEYFQETVGADVEIALNRLLLFGEFAYSRWDASIEEDQLSVMTWYTDIEFKLNPRWFVAGRFDQMLFDDILNPITSKKESWDWDLNRIEAGIGYRITSEATLKAVLQITKWENASRIDDLRFGAIQFSVPF